MITKSNWLRLLREDILSRQTLYPDGGDVGLLTKTNWMVKLRDDILIRQTLYPASENAGLLHTTNWLRKLKREILTNQMLYPEAGIAGLERVIVKSQTLIDNTRVSADGTDIFKSDFWVTQNIYDAFQIAIDSAESILSSVTIDEDLRIKPAIQALNAATYVFKTTRKPGTATPPIPGWEMTYSQPSQVTMNRLIIPLSSFVGYDPSKLTDMNGPNGVYDSSWNPTGNAKLFAKYTMLPEDDWAEVSLDDQFSHRPTNRLIVWEWETPNVRITGDNSTSQPISLRLVLGG